MKADVFLVDTNVLSELNKPVPNRGVFSWVRRQSVVRVSVITLMEIEFGIENVSGARREQLRGWFASLLDSPAYVPVPIDVAISRTAGQLKAQAQRVGRPKPLADLLIAATALVTGLVVVTRNTADFDGLGVAVLNPFD